MAKYHDISIALAGVCQAAVMVQEFATNGVTDSNSLRTSLQSLLITNPTSTLDVFENDLSKIKLGLETLIAQLGGNRQGQLDMHIGRYWIGMLALARKLDQNPAAKSELAQRLAQLERQLPLYNNDILEEQIISNIAAIYSDIISPLGAKIQVFGRQDLLARRDIQNRVRATLLAGVRAAILWQQVGGSRWQLFFSRSKMLNQAKSFYQTISFGDS